MKIAAGSSLAGMACAVLLAGSASADTSWRQDPSTPLPPPGAQEAAPAAVTAQPEPQAVAVAPAEAVPAVAYGDLIAQHAQAAGIPVGLASAVVQIESNFNAKARGRSGEVGLMQINPRTARGIGYGGDVAGLYEPATNLTWGMKYLAGAYQLAGGDVCGTIMRYQGGHRATRMTGANQTYCARVKKIMAANGEQVAGL